MSGGMIGKRVNFVSGTPWKTIILFAIPLMLGNMFQQLYNTVDGVIVGRGVSHVGLAAVGVSGPFLRVLTAAFMGVSMGANILISQYFGAKNESSLRRTLHTAVFLALIVGILLSAAGVLSVPLILRMLGTPEDVYPMALAYMRILFSGIAFQLLYNMIASFIRGLGNSRTPVLILVISAITNVILTWIFVINLNWGVEGSAYGTIISQFVSVILVLLYIQRNPLTRISVKEIKLNTSAAKEILKTGVPTAIQHVAMSVGGIVVMGFITPYGTAAIAGYTAGLKIDMFINMPMMSLNMAITPYTGQNVGAGRMDRVLMAAKQGIILNLIINITLSAIVLIFSRELLMLFTDDTGTIAEGIKMLGIIVPAMAFAAINHPMAGIMRGSGETVMPMISALMMVLIVRIPLILLFTHLFHRVEAIYYSQLFAQLYGVIHIALVYRKGNWKKKAIGKISAMNLD